LIVNEAQTGIPSAAPLFSQTALSLKKKVEGHEHVGRRLALTSGLKDLGEGGIISRVEEHGLAIIAVGHEVVEQSWHMNTGVTGPYPQGIVIWQFRQV
jgi:hypothetical protein